LGGGSGNSLGVASLENASSTFKNRNGNAINEEELKV
jgi:hypothetical protein